MMKLFNLRNDASLRREQHGEVISDFEMVSLSVYMKGMVLAHLKILSGASCGCVCVCVCVFVAY
jgi:hypothetical protein